MFAIMRRHVTVATALGCAATLLVSYSKVKSSDGKSENTDASTSTTPVSVDPAASRLTEHVSTYNFIRTSDDGSMKILATVQVISFEGWMGLSGEKGQFTTLKEGKYTVQARGASGCSSIRGPTTEGLSVIGEVHVDSKQNADVWSVLPRMDEDSFITVALVDSNGDLASYAKTVAWTEPTEENDS